MSKQRVEPKPAGPGMTSEGAERIRGLETALEATKTKIGELEEQIRIYEDVDASSLADLKKALGFPENSPNKWQWVLDEVMLLKERANAKPPPPPAHVVRAFEHGAKAERARVLEQSRVELLSWPAGTPERRALEALRKALQDERLTLPEFKP